MSVKKLFCVCLSVMLILALLCACAGAFAEGAPSIRFEDAEVTVAVKKSVKAAPVAENVEKPRALKYAWASSDESVAVVKNGSVTGVAPGEAEITCTTELPDGTPLSCALKVRVVEPVKSLKITTKANTAVKAGETLAVEYTIQPENATDKSLTWQSSDENIAAVDENGVVTALSAGKVNITAVTNDGSKKQAKVSLYIPALYCETAQLDLADTAGADFELGYFGADWDGNVTVKAAGKAFSYRISREGTRVLVHVDGESAGTGKLEITDKTDRAGKVTVSVNVAQGAVPLRKQVVIERITWKLGHGSVTIRNNTGGAINDVEIISRDYNQAGERIFCTEEGYDSIGEEYNYLYINKDIAKGQPRTLRCKSLPYYPDSVRADFTVSQYRKEDGTIVRIPDNGLHWYDSEGNEYTPKPELADFNCHPGQEALDRAAGLKLGYTNATVEEWIVPHYGFQHGGIYIKSVTAGSIAEKAGLQPRDLIIAVDGVFYGDDAYIITKGKLKILDGQSITVTVERPGTEGTIDLTFEPPEEPAA